jgi:hypothetical protein
MMRSACQLAGLSSHVHGCTQKFNFPLLLCTGLGGNLQAGDKSGLSAEVHHMPPAVGSQNVAHASMSVRRFSKASPRR